jgi:hypothetical protein
MNAYFDTAIILKLYVPGVSAAFLWLFTHEGYAFQRTAGL